MVEEMEASWPDWLPKLDRCPADLMPKRASADVFSIERCSAALNECLGRCRMGGAGDCYAAAQFLLKISNGPVPQALFLKACALGYVSGCTNRAASIEKGPSVGCAIRTYQLACDLDDPWACTMIGFHLVRGVGIEKNDDRARKAFSKSCRLGDDDEACRYAKALLKEIGN
jgi:TPR repeat protein